MIECIHGEPSLDRYLSCELNEVVMLLAMMLQVVDLQVVDVGSRYKMLMSPLEHCGLML